MRPGSMAMVTSFACISPRKRFGCCRPTLDDATRLSPTANRSNLKESCKMPPRPDRNTDTVLIAQQAVATLTVPGYVDFLAADGRAVWATNTDRVAQLEAGGGGPT